MNLFERLLCKIADCDNEQKTVIDIFNDYINTAIGQHFQKERQYILATSRVTNGSMMNVKKLKECYTIKVKL